jgi:hypothetical protein
VGITVFDIALADSCDDCSVRDFSSSSLWCLQQQYLLMERWLIRSGLPTQAIGSCEAMGQNGSCVHLGVQLSLVGIATCPWASGVRFWGFQQLVLVRMSALQVCQPVQAAAAPAAAGPGAASPAHAAAAVRASHLLRASDRPVV